MKYLSLFCALFIAFVLVSCDDADDKVTRLNADVTLHKGTMFLLYDKNFQPLDTIFVDTLRMVPGRMSIDSNPALVGYSINGLDYKFNTHSRLHNIYFNYESDSLVWIGSSSTNSRFNFGKLEEIRFNAKDLELEFTEEETLQSFNPEKDVNNIVIRGKITFRVR